MKKKEGPRILIYDIESSPLITYTWGLFDQNIGLNQIVQDRHLLSFAAKFLDEDKVYYSDQSKSRDITNDKPMLEQLHKLFSEADIVIGQNSIAFDTKLVQARMIINGMTPPNKFRQIDTMRLAKKHFNFTSNKLEYLSKTLCPKHKKSEHKKFAGFELWKQCLAKNKEAWKEMKAYNIQDVMATEELYKRLQPFDNSINFNVYKEKEAREDIECNCGSKEFQKRGFHYTNTGKFRKYKCTDCGAWFNSKTNLLSKEKRKTLRKGL